MSSENYYDILQCRRDASTAEIKKNYQRLILEHHPDKNLNNSNSNFTQIDLAWKILRDPVKRKIYDAELCKSEFDQNQNIFAYVTIKDFTAHSSEGLRYPCRCGGFYILEENDICEEIEVECTECSLIVIVQVCS